MMIIFKNFFSFVLTFFAFDWVTKGAGIKTTITIIASIQVAVCLTSIPMCKLNHFPQRWGPPSTVVIFSFPPYLLPSSNIESPLHTDILCPPTP